VPLPLLHAAGLLVDSSLLLTFNSIDVVNSLLITYKKFLLQLVCDILAPGMGCPGPRLNRINSVIIPTRCIFFFGSLSRKNLQVKRAWLGAIWDG
jgi:hypothetical protein